MEEEEEEGELGQPVRRDRGKADTLRDSGGEEEEEEGTRGLGFRGLAIREGTHSPLPLRPKPETAGAKPDTLATICSRMTISKVLVAILALFTIFIVMIG